ncbi:MAG: tetratricopeptide repeat protein [Gemmatimonadota bacterium]
MSSSEIAKLESRWRENPQGLTFAPLAEAYRKMRNIPRALEILSEGLGRHPDYIPASIVLGRCQLDLGDDAQAETAFARVLELDDENVIALKALAEIAERQGRLDEAGARLLSLLAIDRSNDEARIQLARVEELRSSGGAVRTPESEREGAAETPLPMADAASEDRVAAVAEPARAATDFTMDAGDIERATEAPVDSPPLLADLEDNLQPAGDVEPLPDLVPDDAPAISSAGADATAMPGLVGLDFQEHSAGVVPLEDLAPGTASIEPLAELEGAEDILLEPAPTNEFQLSSASDDWGASSEAAGGAEYQLPSAAEELAAFARTESDSAAGDADAIGAEFERSPDDAFGGNLTDAAADIEPALLGDADPFGGLERADDEEALFAPSAAGAPESAGESDAAAPDDDVGAEFEEAVAHEPPVEFAPAGPTLEPAPDEEIDLDDDAAFEEPMAAVSAAPERLAESPAVTGPPGPARFDRDDDEDDGLDSDLVVTESMAELFLRQGHRAEALRVYRELYRRDRDNLGLREKVDELETALAAEAPAAPAAETYRAPEPARSVAAFLSGILAARPGDPPAGWAAAQAPAPLSAEAPPAAAPGEAAPTRPASDHLSLSAVFGEEGSPVPPATPGAAVPGDDGISFDAFFGGDQAGGAPRAHTAAREDDDLDQFHAWLQNLKR